MMPDEMLVIDVKRTKAGLAEIAANFATLIEEKFMLEAEHIESLPEDKRAQAKMFMAKQKENMQRKADVCRSHLLHYVDLLCVADMASSMPPCQTVEQYEAIHGVMKTVALKVLEPMQESKRQAIAEMNRSENQTKH